MPRSFSRIPKTFEKVNNVKVNHQIVERRKGDIAECYADPSYAMEKLGWKAELTLDDMCRDAYEFEVNSEKTD